MAQHYGLSWWMMLVYLQRMYILSSGGIYSISDTSVDWLNVFQVFMYLLSFEEISH